MGHIPVFTGAGAPREQRGGRAVREPPVRVVNNEGFSSMGAIYFDSNHGGGRPRGTPLRGMGSVGGEGTGEGWVPACARTTGGGDDGGGMGPRMREDNEGGGDDGGGMGRIPASVFTGAGSAWEQREGKGGHGG